MNKDNIEWTVKTAGPYVIEKAEMPVTFAASVQSVSSSSDFDPTEGISNSHLFNPQVSQGASQTSSPIQDVKGNPYGYYLFEDEAGNKTTELPTKNGSYKVTLTKQGMSKVQEWIENSTAFPTNLLDNYELVNQAVGVLNVVSTSAMIKYVDADNNDEPIDAQYTQVIAGEPNTQLEFGNKLQIPAGYELAPNQPTSVTLGALGSNTNVTIKLVHKTQEFVETQDRTATVNYVYGNGKQAGQTASPSAQIEFHYTRTNKRDVVTGKVVTEGPWTWDNKYNENGFTNGYHVISGEWTVPSEWGAVSVKNPTVDGYTVFDNGDWTGENHIPANSFVYPTYSNAGTSTAGSSSIAYTPYADTYEAKNIHTVYFVENVQETRTVTEEYHYWKDNQDAGEVFPNSVVDVFFENIPTAFKTNGSSDPAKWTAYYKDNTDGSLHEGGNWQWNKNKGDKGTPGFHVVSGKWNNLETVNGGFSVDTPSKTGYTIIHIREDGGNSTVNFASPNYWCNTVFTGATDGTWYNRNKLITFYVPNSDLTKKITRTITIVNPDGTTTTLPAQEVTFTRVGNVNKGTNTPGDYGDTAVVFSDWTPASGTWEAKDVSKPGYTVLVDGKEVADGKVPAATVNSGDGNATVKVTYTATATATLNGSAASNYTGEPITWDDVNSTADDNNIKVTVSGPNGGDYTLQQGDVEFSANGKDWSTALPTNAGTYQIRWTKAGINHIKSQFGNSAITWGDNDANITGSATYTINAATVDVTLSGSGTKVYDGQPVSTVELNNEANGGKNNIHAEIQVFINGTIQNIDYLLQDGDYTWVDYPNPTPDDGHPDYVTNGQAPTDVEPGRPYTIQLNEKSQTFIDHITAAILKQFPDLKGNFSVTSESAGSQDTTFTITPAPAKLQQTGSAEKIYDGKAGSVTIDQLLNNLKPSLADGKPLYGDDTFNTTGLTLDDFDWYNGDTDLGKVSDATKAPVNVGNYTIKLNQDGLDKIAGWSDQNYNPNYSFLTGPDGDKEPNYSGAFKYDINPVTLTVTQSGSASVDYDASAKSPSLSDVLANLKATAGLVNGESLNTTGLTLADFDWTADQTNAGTYTLKLNDAGLKKLQDNNKNYSISSVAGNYTFTIKKATPTVVFNGVGSKTFGQDDTKWTTPAGLTITDAQGMGDQTITLANGDYEFVGQDGTVYASVPTNAGTYKVQLTDQGKAKITGSTINSANLDWAKAQISGEGSFTVNAVAGTAKLSGTNSRDYNGSAVTTTDINNGGNIVVTIAIPNSDRTISYKLADGDYTWNSADPTNVGTYTIELNKANILAHLQAQIAQDPDWKGNVTLTDADLSGTATFTINQEAISVSLTGSNDANIPAYTGSPVSTPVEALKKALTNADGLELSGLLKNGFDWYDASGNKLDSAPTDAGSYTLKLNDTGLRQIRRKNPNYNVSIGTNSYDFKINPAVLTVTQSGSAAVNYNATAQSPSLEDVLANLKATAGLVNGESLNTTGLTLVDDFGWAAKTDAGKYTLKLNAAGLKKLQANNPNYQINSVDGSYTFTINKVAGKATFTGEGTKTYDGSAIDNYQPTVTVTAPGTAATVNLAAGTDYVWYLTDASGNKTGNALTTAPVDAGKYVVELTAAGKDKIKALNSNNINWTDNAITGTASYVINKATATVNFAEGSGQTVIYTGQPGKFAASKFAPVISTNNGQTITIPEGVQLGDGDFEFISEGQTTGSTIEPTARGTYTVKLTTAGFAKLKSALNNYNWENNAQASYNIKANDMATVSISNKAEGGQHVTYNGNNFGSNDIDVNNYQLTLPTGMTYQLQAGDLEIVPVANQTANVGQYKVQLTQAGQQHLQAAANGDFTFDFTKPGVETTTATFTVDKATPSVSFHGNGSKTYGDATPVWNPEIGLTITAPGVGTDQTIDLTTGDYEFVAKDGTTSTTIPTNVGDYTIQLTEQGKQKIQGSSINAANLDWAKATISGEGSFTVKAKATNVTLNGQTSVTYNGNVATLPFDKLKQSISNSDNLDLSGLTADGFDWYDADGNKIDAPTNHGVYTIKLNKTGLQQIQDKNSNYKVAIDQAGAFTFTIETAKGHVALTGDRTVEFGTNDTDYLNHYTVTLTTNPETITGFTPQFTLQAGDLEFSNDGGKTWSTTVPTKVGEYKVKLSDAARDRIVKNNNASGNIEWPATDFTGVMKYTVTPAQSTASLSGSATRPYNGSSVTVDDINNTGSSIEVTINLPGGRTTTYKLADGDYTWLTTDGVAPVNAGDYQLKFNLTEQGKTNLQNWLNEQTDAGTGLNNAANVLAPTEVTGTATFTVTPVALNVKFEGNGSKVYNGEAADVTFDQLKNSITATGLVGGTQATALANSLLMLAVTDGDQLNVGTLTLEDFDWLDANGNNLGNLNNKSIWPKNVGNYTIKLNADGLKALQDANKNYTINDLSTNAYAYAITKAKADVTFDGGSQEVNYTGETGKFNPDNFKPAVKTNNGQTITLPADLNLSVADGDFEFIPEGSTTGSTTEPTAKGTYTVKLTQQGLNKVAKVDTNNYDWTNSTNGTYTIGAVPINISGKGSQTTTYDGTSFGDAVGLDLNTFKPTLTADNVTVPTIPAGTLTAGDYTIKDKDGNVVTDPTNAGDYTVWLNEDGLKKLANLSINFTWPTDPVQVGTLTIKSKVIFQFVDDDKKDAQGQPSVVTTSDPYAMIKGQSNQIDPALTIPDNYKLASGELPTDYTPEGNDPVVQIHLVHKTQDVTNDDSQKDQVSKTVTYKVVEDFGGQQTTVVDKSATFTRTATKDLVTGDVTYGEWTGNNVPVLEQDVSKPGYTAHASEGELTNGTTVPAYTITPDSADKTITITYTANEQSVTIKFVDDQKDGAQVGDLITKKGKTDENIQLGLSVPENYELAKGQTLPTNYTFTSAENQTITIHLVHQTKPVDGNSTDIPDNITQQLNDEVTRTINYEGLSADQLAQLPAGQKNGTKQAVKFVGSATYDLVDKTLVGDITWQAGTPASYEGFTPKSFPGYTATVNGTTDNKVPTFSPKAGDKDSTVTITYTANEQTVTIKFVDDDNGGSQVGQTISVSGKTGDTLPLNLMVPANYQLAAGQTLPTEYTFKAEGNEPIVIHLVHQTTPVQDTKVVTETIKYQFEDGTEAAPSHEVKVTFTRTGSKDAVTGNIVWDHWTPTSQSFAPVTSPVINGYEPDQSVIGEQVVNVESSDLNFTVTYTKVKIPDQPTNPDHPAQPEVPETPTKPDTPNTPNLPADGGHQSGEGQNQAVDHQNGQKSKQGRLPQTGNDADPSSLGLLVLGATSLLGLGLKKKKERE